MEKIFAIDKNRLVSIDTCSVEEAKMLHSCIANNQFPTRSMLIDSVRAEAAAGGQGS